MKSKITKVLTATLALFVAMLCVLGAGCGEEDLTFEDGEYTAVLVAQPDFFSSWESGFKVFINGEELSVFKKEYCGTLTKTKIDKKNWNKAVSDKDEWRTSNDFDVSSLKNIGYCLKTNEVLMGEYYYIHALIKSKGKSYLIVLPKEQNTVSGFVKIWELVPVV